MFKLVSNDWIDKEDMEKQEAEDGKRPKVKRELSRSLSRKLSIEQHPAHKEDEP